MKKEIAELICKALNSGEFPQSKGFLYKARRFCVLGVIADLAMVEGVCDFAYDEKKQCGFYDGLAGVLPPSVVEWAGMKSRSGAVDFVTLTFYNDNGWSFPELAVLIAENYEQI